jgi:transcriptional regulator with XRE-family HTH domain
MFYDLHYIGEQLKSVRVNAGMTQVALAGDSGVSRATINALENFKSKDISVNTLSLILNALASKSILDTTESQSQVTRNQPRFDFPYVWSQSSPSDELLIQKVLERSVFDDVLTLCAHYGLSKVTAVLYGSPLKEDEVLMRSLRRMLTNVQKGFAHA